MPETTQFTIGTEARCTDGVCGEVSRVVVDPVAEAVTHLVVEPKDRKGLARLVPVDLVEGGASELRLRCTLAAFDKLDPQRKPSSCPAASGTPPTGPSRWSAGRTTG